MNTWFRKTGLSLYRAVGSPASGTIALVLMATVLWAIALGSPTR